MLKVTEHDALGLETSSTRRLQVLAPHRVNGSSLMNVLSKAKSHLVRVAQTRHQGGPGFPRCSAATRQHGGRGGGAKAWRQEAGDSSGTEDTPVGWCTGQRGYGGPPPFSVALVSLPRSPSCLSPRPLCCHCWCSDRSRARATWLAGASSTT